MKGKEACVVKYFCWCLTSWKLCRAFQLTDGVHSCGCACIQSLGEKNKKEFLFTDFFLPPRPSFQESCTKILMVVEPINMWYPAEMLCVGNLDTEIILQSLSNLQLYSVYCFLCLMCVSFFLLPHRSFSSYTHAPHLDCKGGRLISIVKSRYLFHAFTKENCSYRRQEETDEVEGISCHF